MTTKLWLVVTLILGIGTIVAVTGYTASKAEGEIITLAAKKLTAEI